METYEAKLRQEADLWGHESEVMAQSIPPDWRAHKDLMHNRILHGTEIEGLLACVRPGMRVAELGCASGWLTLAMAQRGAHATGFDVSERSLTIARDYYDRIASDVAGEVDYAYADLNVLTLEPNTYDVIAVKATLHHLVNMSGVIEMVHTALKPGGLFWIADTLYDEHLSAVLVASGLTFLLPTAIPYDEKIKGLMAFGIDAPSRIKMSMEAEGLSPFEGAGRNHDWLAIVHEHFAVQRLIVPPAVTGYVTAQLALPDSIAEPFLRVLKQIDLAMVQLGILKPSARVVFARK